MKILKHILGDRRHKHEGAGKEENVVGFRERRGKRKFFNYIFKKMTIVQVS